MTLFITPLPATSSCTADSTLSSDLPARTAAADEAPPASAMTQIATNEAPQEQHFCCASVDLSGKGSGKDCSAASAELINSCKNVLFCSGNWGKDGQTVSCL